jgi:hypothetical protein
MSQRGVRQSEIDFVLDHGTVDQDKYVVSKRDALREVERLKREIQVAMKIADKGGVVVVAEGESLITTYNFKCSV